MKYIIIRNVCERKTKMKKIMFYNDKIFMKTFRGKIQVKHYM